MKLLYVSTFMFHVDDDKLAWALPSCADAFFGKYLDVFDSVQVIGEEIKHCLDKSALIKITNRNIDVKIIPSNTHPRDFLNDGIIRNYLYNAISNADAILIKPATRRGMMAIRIAEKLQKPYMIEMTGDIHNALKQNPSFLRRIYADLLYKQIKHAIANCKFGLYVSKDYLQGKYPIPGRMCGCADVVLEDSQPAVLERRLRKIDSMQQGDIINLALIGFYQGNGKGVDTAIRALSHLKDNFHLAVLGNGTEESRQKWYNYAKKYGVKSERLHFPAPLPSANAVLHWLDDYDFFVFPTRSEGFGRCVAEAMSRGVPCFATDICTMPELLPQECLFALDDDGELAELLIKYSNDKNLMKRLARLNFEHAKDYDANLLKQRRDAFLGEFKEYCIAKKGKSSL